MVFSIIEGTSQTAEKFSGSFLLHSWHAMWAYVGLICLYSELNIFKTGDGFLCCELPSMHWMSVYLKPLYSITEPVASGMYTQNMLIAK